MALTPVPSTTAVPDFPALSDRALGTYNSKAYAWAVFMAGTFMTQLIALVTSAYNNAVEAFSGATIATSAAITATTAASVSLGASNFKGDWSSLTGALAKPASVRYGGRFWLLLNNLANVTTSTPGVSADWAALDAGVAVTQSVTSNTTAIAGVTYLLESGVVLTLPTTFIKGDFIGIRKLSTAVRPSVDFGSTPLWGNAVGVLILDAPAASLDLRYENATWGMQ